MPPALPLQESREVLGQRVLELESLALQRVGKAQRSGVQQGAGAIDGGAGVVSPIKCVTDDGVTDMREVNPDLMSAAGLQATHDDGAPAQPLLRGDVCDAVAAQVGLRRDTPDA